ALGEVAEEGLERLLVAARRLLGVDEALVLDLEIGGVAKVSVVQRKWRDRDKAGVVADQAKALEQISLDPARNPDLDSPRAGRGGQPLRPLAVELRRRFGVDDHHRDAESLARLPVVGGLASVDPKLPRPRPRGDRVARLEGSEPVGL